ncbi:MAG: hypothetical protein AAFX40_16260 [Cyanobacteria bacterium J06639_1]
MGIAPWRRWASVASSIVLGACGADSGAITSAPPASVTAVSVAPTPKLTPKKPNATMQQVPEKAAAQSPKQLSASDRVSLVFQQDPTIATAADAAIVAAFATLSGVPLDEALTGETLTDIANRLLRANAIDPANLNGTIEASDVNFITPEAIDLADVAVVLAAADTEAGTPSKPTLAAATSQLLGRPIAADDIDPVPGQPFVSSNLVSGSSTLEGRLELNDNFLSTGEFIDLYGLVGVKPGDSVTVTLSSPEFDTYLGPMPR